MLGGKSQCSENADWIRLESVPTGTIPGSRQMGKNRQYVCRYCDRSHSSDFRKTQRSQSEETVKLLLDSESVSVRNPSAKDICKKCHSKCTNTIAKIKQSEKRTPHGKLQGVSEYRLCHVVARHQRQTRNGMPEMLQPISPGKLSRDGSMILVTPADFITAAEQSSACPHCHQSLQNAAPLKMHGAQVGECFS